MRPTELHSSSTEENCLTENVALLRSVKVATPLASQKRLSPVDLPSANGFNKPFAASKFDTERPPFVKGVKIQVTTFDEIMSLDIEAFFEYVKSLQYGYQDKFGGIHVASDKDFAVKDYSFSSPEEIVKTNCGWCWDLAEFIKLYCTRHGIICKSYFMEYFSNELHQTHTQVFLYSQGKWSAAPDNCLGLIFGTPSFNELEDCVQWFLSLFTGYLMSVLKEKYDKENLLIKEYTCSFSAGISDEEYLSQVRNK